METFELVFDDASQVWRKDAEYNMFFLQAQQNFFNQKLQTMGHVFLNEVFDALGAARTTKGALCGWLASGEAIDFHLPGPGQFVGAIKLTFNVETIYDKIEGVTI